MVPALVAGILHVISLIIFLYGGDSVAINVFAMVEYQADERAGVVRLSWRVSGR